MKNIVILISGGGSNMRAILEHATQNNWATRLNVQVSLVLSNKLGAQGLSLAQDYGVSTAAIEHTEFKNAEDPRLEFDKALIQKIDTQQPILVVLAGFMRILTPYFVNHYRGRLLNIHPSLLPAFKGLHTHARAIETGCKFSGASVHEVSEELDHGRILEQAVVPILKGDTAQDLASRVLTQEHIIYPRAIERWLIDNK
jgi:phosphoribosylglycinamide formyltransferase 1